jgi:BirA family biotin operon repressor/biotin-[acetyl-CoA-carboxylase] ligase
VFLEERVRADLASSTRFSDVHLLEVTDSTNRVVADMAASGAPDGVVVVADLQTAGRGRLDRTWEAEPGDALLVSLLLRPEGLPLSRWHLVTAAAGLAASDACAEVAGVRPELKWPNDLMSGRTKLAGILAESTAGALVLGMGLNVHSGPPGSAWIDDLAGRRVARSSLLVAWLKQLDRLMGDWESVASRYRRECATVGQQVSVEQVGSRLVGVAEDIDAEGRLVVRPAGPTAPPVAVSAGDVVHLRPAHN